MIIGHRAYQQTAIDRIFDAWKNHRSTLLVLPTGTGKTVVFSEIIRRLLPLRTLVVAHREELIWQAKDKVSRVTSMVPGVEMGDFHARMAQPDLFTGDRPPVVIATVQTLNSMAGDRKRMTRFLPQDFNTLIIDECHHSVAKSYQHIIDYFSQNPNLRVLGVTATPDRTDQLALGKIFDSVAFDYSIHAAITDGWLVNPVQSVINIEKLDYSHIRTLAGDLHSGELAKVMEAEENLQGIAGALTKIVGDRRTLVFTVSVKQAEQLAEIMTRHFRTLGKPGRITWVCGKTEKEKRREIVKDFAAGRYQVVVNCDCFTEGFDDPGVEVLGIAKPTKSRSKYAQMVGRVLRPLPGLVDPFAHERLRVEAIGASRKPYAEVVDFCGNAGRHKLVTVVDILGGKYEDDVVEKAREIIRKRGNAVSVQATLDEAQELKRKQLEERRMQEQARRAKLVAKVEFNKKEVNPFNLLDITPRPERRQPDNRQLSKPQHDLLLRQGIDPTAFTYNEARQLLNEMFRRWHNNLATLKQIRLLKKYGYDTRDLTMSQATRIIDLLKANGWRKVELNETTPQGVRETQVSGRDRTVPF